MTTTETKLAIWIERLPNGELRRVEQLVRETEDEGYVAHESPYPVDDGCDEEEDAGRGVHDELADLEPYHEGAQIVASFFGD